MQLRLGKTPKMGRVELHILNQYHVINQLIPPRKLDYNHRATFSSASLVSFVIPTTAKRHKNQVNDLRVGTSTSTPSLAKENWAVVEFLKVVFGEVGHWKIAVFLTVQRKLAGTCIGFMRFATDELTFENTWIPTYLDLIFSMTSFSENSCSKTDKTNFENFSLHVGV